MLEIPLVIILTTQPQRKNLNLKDLSRIKKELKRILRLAKQSESVLQNNIGCIDLDLRTEQNLEEALRWYLKSVEQGFR